MPRAATVPARVCILLFLACAAHQSLAAAAGSSSAVLASGTLALSLVPTDTADRYGAKCIDGTPPALYISRNESSTQWVVFFKGGGWCFNEADCYQRASSQLGSSSSLDPTFNWDFGVTQGSAEHNPHFHTFNRVVLWYCDGGSWSGMNEAPITVQGKQLWFRGRANLNAQFADLTARFGFGGATEVLLGGGSAGALSSYLHANYVQAAWLPSSVRKFKLMPASGFFLNATNTLSTRVYGDAITYMGNMMNSSYGVNADCIEATPSNEWFKCLTAAGTYPFLKMPTFVLNSVHDYWQVMCVLTASPTSGGSSEACASVPGWHDCAVAGNDHLSKCNSTQIGTINAYGNNMLATLKDAMATAGPNSMMRPGNGAFLSSCVTHVAMGSNLFLDLTIHGVSMSDAIAAWWNAAPTAPAAGNTYLPCELDPSTTTHQCNPTCT